MVQKIIENMYVTYQYIPFTKPRNLYRLIMINIHCLLFVFFLSSFFSVVNSQEIKTEQSEKEMDRVPIENTFEDSRLINLETIKPLRNKSLQFTIQHRFDRIDEGFEKGKNFNLFGLLGVANIRLGVNYGLTNKLTIGIGATKYNYIYDLNLKYLFIQQSQPKGNPLSVSYFGNVAIASYSDEDFNFVDRMSYFHQALIARKITNRISLQLAPSFSYFNEIDTTGGNSVKHANFAISLGGRINVSPQGSIVLEYNQPITVSEYGSLGETEPTKTEPTVGMGYEIATRGHVFQLFITNGNFILNQYDLLKNLNKVTKGEIFIGFNISRNWNF